MSGGSSPRRPFALKNIDAPLVLVQRKTIVQMNTKTGEVSLQNPEAAGEMPKPFTFDQVYDHTTQQKYLFETTAQPIIDCVLQVRERGTHQASRR